MSRTLVLLTNPFRSLADLDDKNSSQQENCKIQIFSCIVFNISKVNH